jgi:hypothetical protein
MDSFEIFFAWGVTCYGLLTTVCQTRSFRVWNDVTGTC